LNTKEFIKALAGRLEISQKEAEHLIEHTSKAIRETIADENKLTIMHLGSFQLKKTSSRSSYIPALDKKALVPPKSSIHFQPADSLKEKLKNISRP
jgi:nucleoid DNA-binding protein